MSIRVELNSVEMSLLKFLSASAIQWDNACHACAHCFETLARKVQGLNSTQAQLRIWSG